MKQAKKKKEKIKTEHREDLHSILWSSILLLNNLPMIFLKNTFYISTEMQKILTLCYLPYWNISFLIDLQ